MATKEDNKSRQRQTERHLKASLAAPFPSANLLNNLHKPTTYHSNNTLQFVVSHPDFISPSFDASLITRTQAHNSN